MSAEAEKVISLSLCKMAESRTTRRGGASLHKHLLIASVLTKATRARSAFLDTWYMGDDDTDDEHVDLNMSFQEADFPTEGLPEGSDLEIDPAIVEQVAAMASGAVSHGTNNGKKTTEICFVREVETEMDLPPDILSCVEKLGDFNDRIFSSTQQQCASTTSSTTSTTNSTSQSSKSIACPLYPSSSANVIPDVIPSPSQSITPVPVSEDLHEEDSQLSSALTYLDLDGGSSTIVDKGSVLAATPTKRRREWCFEEEEEDEECCGNGDLCIETPIKSSSNARNVSSFSKKCKRLRFEDDSGLSLCKMRILKLKV